MEWTGTERHGLDRSRSNSWSRIGWHPQHTSICFKVSPGTGLGQAAVRWSEGNLDQEWHGQGVGIKPVVEKLISVHAAPGTFSPKPPRGRVGPLGRERYVPEGHQTGEDGGQRETGSRTREGETEAKGWGRGRWEEGQIMEEGHRGRFKGQCLSPLIGSDQETSGLPPLQPRDWGPLSSAFCGHCHPSQLPCEEQRWLSHFTTEESEAPGRRRSAWVPRLGRVGVSSVTALSASSCCLIPPSQHTPSGIRNQDPGFRKAAVRRRELSRKQQGWLPLESSCQRSSQPRGHCPIEHAPMVRLPSYRALEKLCK